MTKTLKKWWVAALIFALVLWAVAFHLISLPTSAEKLFIWVGAEASFEQKAVNGIDEFCKTRGIKKTTVSRYNPSDAYYDAAFATSGVNTADIFVLKRSEVENTQNLGLYAPYTLSQANAHVYNGKTIGLSLGQEYYVLLNSKSNKSYCLLEELALMIQGLTLQ